MKIVHLSLTPDVVEVTPEVEAWMKRAEDRINAELERELIRALTTGTTMFKKES